MKIDYKISGNKIVFYGYQNSEDKEFCENKKGKAGINKASFWINEIVVPTKIHNDVLALTALIIFGPFSKKDIQFCWPISVKFIEAVEHYFRRNIKSEGTCESRQFSKSGRPSLAFSGGVDSVAASEILPSDTVSVFCNRVIPEGFSKGLYKADAAKKSCSELKAYRDVEIVHTDMEFTREPVGFSVDWTNAAGALLLSEHYNINSVSFGMIMESAFWLGRSKYSNLETRTIYSAWAPIFESVGIPISLPVASISEAVTSKIANAISSKISAQSCVRGLEDKPCMNCYKCFRKTILDAKITKTDVKAAHYNIAYTSKEVARKLTQFPIHHENVLAFSVVDLKPSSHQIDELIRQKMQPIIDYGQNLDWLEKAYLPGLRLVPEHLRDHIKSRISEYVNFMSEDDEKFVSEWNTSDINDSEEYVKAHDALVEHLKDHHSWLKV